MTVHPRERGEHFNGNKKCYRVTGSSPRARGTHLLNRFWSLPDRFIPASAGNTPSLMVPVDAYSVHPRERGEHRDPQGAWFGFAGSSPRARGTRRKRPSNDPRRRFIPASAGNTIARIRVCVSRTVHPRERGEHSSRTYLIFKRKSGTHKSTRKIANFKGVGFWLLKSFFRFIGRQKTD